MTRYIRWNIPHCEIRICLVELKRGSLFNLFFRLVYYFYTYINIVVGEGGLRRWLGSAGLGWAFRLGAVECVFAAFSHRRTLRRWRGASSRGRRRNAFLFIFLFFYFFFFWRGRKEKKRWNGSRTERRARARGNPHKDKRMRVGDGGYEAGYFGAHGALRS